MTTRKYTSKSQQTTLTSSVTSGATLFPVVSAQTLLGGATISAGQTMTIVIDPDTSLEEIVDIYSSITNPVSGNNLTVVRGADGTSAQDHSAGAVIRHMVIGRDLREANTHIEASTGVHGLANTSSLVGTIETQTLLNKTLTAPSISAATLTDGITLTGTITGGAITGAIITGLSSSNMATSSATPKSYVDAKVAGVTGFNGVYLGTYSTPPTTDNAGGSLTTGMMYFDNNTKVMKVYDGTNWVNVVTNAQLFRYKYTATTGQQTITGTDMNGLTLSYVVGSELVYLNGVLLLRGTDYTATNGTSISITNVMLANDVIEIMVFSQFSVTQGITSTQYTAKGDLIAGTAASTVTNIAVGSDGYFLKADSTTNTGLRWVAISQYSLPSQNNNTGYFLQTNGTSESWQPLVINPTLAKAYFMKG